MAATDDDSGSNQFEKLIAATYRRVVAARQEYTQAQLRGDVTTNHVVDLAKATYEYHSILYEHHDEDVLDPEWEDRNLDWLNDYRGESVTVEQSAPGMTSNTVEKEIPAILTVNPERIVQLTRKLDTVRKELGFSAQVSESHPHVELTDELLEEVEEWRQTTLED
jgi:hypothetical protein